MEAQLAIFFIVAVIWRIVGIEQCHHNGGIVIAPLTRL
jgi:hypothetical protein